MQEYIGAKTLEVYGFAKQTSAAVVGNLEGGEIPSLFSWKVELGVGEVTLHENNFSGGMTKTGKPRMRRESIAQYLARKEQNPKEGPGNGWLTKALRYSGFSAVEGA